MTAMRRPPGAFTGTPYITAREIADRLGILETSVRTQMRAMRRRKTDPVDFRVPDDERAAWRHGGEVDSAAGDRKSVV